MRGPPAPRRICDDSTDQPPWQRQAANLLRGRRRASRHTAVSLHAPAPDGGELLLLLGEHLLGARLGIHRQPFTECADLRLDMGEALARAPAELRRLAQQLRSRNVTVEVNTVFENLQSVVGAIDPAKLNAILSAFSQALRGKGDRLGQAITDANDLLLTVNPRMSTIHQDWRLFSKTAAAYSDAAQDILSILDSAVIPSATITANQQALDTLLCRRSASAKPASASSAHTPAPRRRVRSARGRWSARRGCGAGRRKSQRAAPRQPRAAAGSSASLST